MITVVHEKKKKMTLEEFVNSSVDGDTFKFAERGADLEADFGINESENIFILTDNCDIVSLTSGIIYYSERVLKPKFNGGEFLDKEIIPIECELTYKKVD